MTAPVDPAQAHRSAVLRRSEKREWYGSALIAASLLVHAGALALLVRSPSAAAAKPPAEIPVEVVQAMPPEKPAPTPPPKVAPPGPETPRRTEPPAPVKRDAERKPATKPPAPKAAATRPATKTAAAKPKGLEPHHEQASEAVPQRSVADRMAQLLGPMPAAVIPTTTTGDSSLDDTAFYRQLVLSQVARQRREDRHNGIPGHVVVAFTVGAAGEVVSCAVKEKSVDPALDSEAVAMVYRGAPYPPPPADAQRAFTFGLAFRPT